MNIEIEDVRKFIEIYINPIMHSKQLTISRQLICIKQLIDDHALSYKISCFDKFNIAYIAVENYLKYPEVLAFLKPYIIDVIDAHVISGEYCQFRLLYNINSPKLMSLMEFIIKYDLNDILQYIISKDTLNTPMNMRFAVRPFRIADERPIIIAALNKATNCMEILLNSGADPNTNSYRGWPAICIVAYHGNIESVKLLLKHNVNLRSTNTDSKTALEIALLEGHKEIYHMVSQEFKNQNINSNFRRDALIHNAIPAVIKVYKKEKNLDRCLWSMQTILTLSQGITIREFMNFCNDYNVNNKLPILYQFIEKLRYAQLFDIYDHRDALRDCLKYFLLCSTNNILFYKLAYGMILRIKKYSTELYKAVIPNEDVAYLVCFKNFKLIQVLDSFPLIVKYLEFGYPMLQAINQARYLCEDLNLLPEQNLFDHTPLKLYFINLCIMPFAFQENSMRFASFSEDEISKQDLKDFLNFRYFAKILGTIGIAKESIQNICRFYVGGKNEKLIFFLYQYFLPAVEENYRIHKSHSNYNSRIFMSLAKAYCNFRNGKWDQNLKIDREIEGCDNNFQIK